VDQSYSSKLKKLSGPILITGHTGFKGAWLTQVLGKLGIPAVGLSLPALQGSLYERAKMLGHIPEIFGDVCDLNVVMKTMTEFKPSAVIHMAAQPLVLESYISPRKTFETNVMGTVNLLDAAVNSASVQATVVITTDKVYKNSNTGKRFIEGDPLGGKDPYSASKSAAEMAVTAWSHMAQLRKSAPVISVRAGNVIGGGDWSQDRLLPDLVKGFYEEKEVFVRNSESTRPWQHVVDPLQGYLLALNEMLKGNLEDSLNFGPIEPSLSVAEVVKLARTSWPSNTAVTFQQSDNKSESVTLELDSSRARDFLGWKPVWSQEEAVISTIKWWDSVLNKGTHPLAACELDIQNFAEQRGAQ
jgi:CDP-glucose 4,6-dehydratase